MTSTIQLLFIFLEAWEGWKNILGLILESITNIGVLMKLV